MVPGTQKAVLETAGKDLCAQFFWGGIRWYFDKKPQGFLDEKSSTLRSFCWVVSWFLMEHSMGFQKIPCGLSKNVYTGQSLGNLVLKKKHCQSYATAIIIRSAFTAWTVPQSAHLTNNYPPVTLGWTNKLLQKMAKNQHSTSAAAVNQEASKKKQHFFCSLDVQFNWFGPIVVNNILAKAAC